jgi:cellulose synthase/poly-beta-1,6-N-acetylglucosamine synthase-like glycosyltransferase
VLAIVDADGQLEPDCLNVVAPYFADPAVGTVQIGVRIANAGESTLARMQDIEFVGFSWLVQVARDRLGSSGLGGNGQFTRLDALAGLGSAPWAPRALTEDLDLGLRLVEQGWRTRFCHETSVRQQGLNRWKPLLRQRTRWIQGHYQCWRHIGPLLRSQRTRLRTRLDLILYLVLVTTVLLVSATVVIGFLASFGLAGVRNDFFSFVPSGPRQHAFLLALSVLPVAIFMWTYQRRSGSPFRWFEVPTFAVVFTLYSYVWLYTSLRALARLSTGRNTWVKTPRNRVPTG